MKGHFKDQGRAFEVDFSAGIDISIPISSNQNQVRAFGASEPKITALEVGGFVGSVAKGGSCNCETIVFTPHCHGTHTEGIGHITQQSVKVIDVLTQTFFLAELVSVNPITIENGDKVITRELLSQKISNNFSCKALIIRTLPNPSEKLTRNYSGTNPPYLLEEATAYLAQIGVEHLVLDLPSVDREDDGGKLLAHRAFWQKGRERCTVTELAYIPERVVDGKYLLDLQVAPILSDAAPSRPILYSIR